MKEIDRYTEEKLLEIVARMSEIAKQINEIYSQREKISQTEIKKILKEKKKIQLRYIVEISTKKDPSGKKMYSNQKLRDAELFFRLENDPTYNEYLAKEEEINQKISKLEDKADSLKVEYDRLKNILLIFTGKYVDFEIKECELYEPVEKLDSDVSPYFDSVSELNRIIDVEIEYTTDFDAWKEVIPKMVRDNILVDAYYSINFDNSPNKITFDNIDKSSMRIMLLMPKLLFYRWLGFFIERIKEGDSISVHCFDEILQSLLDSDEYS